MNWRINLLDTSTVPSEAMREAMYNAEVGDDVYREDPTVNQLEAESAAIVGKEAALFVPSGTMGNLCALLAHTERGEEVILEAESHIFYYEAGGLATVAGLMPRLVEGERGVLSAHRVEAALRQPDDHYPRTSLLCIENTHNRAGGTVTSPEVMRDLRALCDGQGLKLHLDGARIFHAAVALGRPVTHFTSQVDTVMFCLSKGLGAPVGSILAGGRGSIDQARRARKMLGGGMRQAGILAAAGLVALRENIDQLKEDHEKAGQLARALAQIPEIRIDMDQVQTNIVLVDVSPSGMSADEVKEELGKRGINVSARPPHKIRMVVHRDLPADQIPEAVSALAAVVATPESGRLRMV